MKTLAGLNFYPPPGTALDMNDIRLSLRQVLNIPFLINERFDRWSRNFNRLRQICPQAVEAVVTEHVVVVDECAQELELQVGDDNNEPVVYILFSQKRHEAPGNQKDYYIGSSTNLLRRLRCHEDPHTALTGIFDTSINEQRRRGALLTAWGQPWKVVCETHGKLQSQT